MQGLEACSCNAGIPNICEVCDCPYRDTPLECVHRLANDALNLIWALETK